MPGRRRPAAGRGGKKKAEAGEAKPKERKQRPKKEVEEDEMDYAEPVRAGADRCGRHFFPAEAATRRGGARGRASVG